MTYKLSPQLEAYVQEQVKAGRFHSAEEAVQAGVARMMLDPEPDVLDEQDIEDIKRSLEQIKRGQVIDATELHARLRKRYLGE